MKILSLFVLFLSSFSLAATQEGYLIKTKLNYQTGNKKVSVAKDFILAKGNNTWVTLTDLKENVVLLGRAKEVTEESIHMEYIVIDGNIRPNGVVSMPSIMALFGIPSEISTGKYMEKPDLTISMTAKRVDFTPEEK